MACPPNLVRYIFVMFSVTIWIFGLIVLTVGIYTRVEDDMWVILINMDTTWQSANLLIAAGTIVTILGFLGCYGAFHHQETMMKIYSIVVFLILILQIAAGACAITDLGKVEQKLTDGVEKCITENYGKEDEASIDKTTAIDHFQGTVKCCGASGPDDWLKSYWYRQTNNTSNNTEHAKVPTSCCRTVAPKCNVNVNANSTAIYNQGCIAAGTEYAKSNVKLIARLSIGVAVVELLGVVLAMCLYRDLRREAHGHL